MLLSLAFVCVCVCVCVCVWKRLTPSPAFTRPCIPCAYVLVCMSFVLFLWAVSYHTTRMVIADARERQIVPRTIRTSFPALASLIRLLLHPDPTKRPTARSLLQHPACARSMATVKSPVLRIVREHDSEYCKSGSDVAGDGMHSVSDSDSKGVDGCDAENATRKTAVCSAADDTGESEGEGEGESEGGGEGEGEGAVAGTPTAPTGTDPCGRSPQEKDRLIRHQQREIEALRQEVEQLRKELVARASRCLCCATRAAQEGNGGPKASLS